VEKFISAFRRIAGRLNVCKADPKAECFFELLSGGLIWTDERPSFEMDVEELGALRILWNYRTSLLVGKPRTEFQDVWDTAIALAPHWPGFLAERQRPRSDIMALIPDSKGC
jgi:hypothetical protein